MDDDPGQLRAQLLVQLILAGAKGKDNAVTVVVEQDKLARYGVMDVAACEATANAAQRLLQEQFQNDAYLWSAGYNSRNGRFVARRD